MKLITAANLIGAIGLVVASTGACASPASDESTTSTVSDRLDMKQGVGPFGGQQGPQGPQYQQGQQGPQYQQGQQGPQYQQGQQGPQYQQGQQGPQGATGTEQGQEQQGDPTGIGSLIADGLSRVHLNQDQRGRVEDLGKRVNEREQAVTNAHHDLRDALAEQVRAGKVDEHALDNDVDALVRAREEASPVLRRAFEDLHGILNPQQRGELVDAITNRLGDTRDDAGQWFDQLSRDLQLTDEQKPRVREILDGAKPTIDEDSDRARRVIDAFKGDQFDVDEIVPVEEVGSHTRDRARGMIGIARDLVDVLTPEQRSRLADKLEQRGQEEGRGQQGQPGQYGPQQGGPGQYGPQQGQYGPQQGQYGPQQGAPGQFGQQGAPGQFGPQQPQGSPIQPQMTPLGATHDAFVAGGGFRAGGFRAGGFRGWGGGGFRAGHVTVARGGYAAGYPFIGGYAPFIW